MKIFARVWALAPTALLAAIACGKFEHTVGELHQKVSYKKDTSVAGGEANPIKDASLDGEAGAVIQTDAGGGVRPVADSNRYPPTDGPTCVPQSLRPKLDIYLMVDKALTLDIASLIIPSFVPVDLSWLFSAAKDQVGEFVRYPANVGVGVGIQFFGTSCWEGDYATPAVEVYPLDSSGGQANRINNAFFRTTTFTAPSEPVPALQAAIKHVRDRAVYQVFKNERQVYYKQVVFLITARLTTEPAGCGYQYGDLTATAEEGFKGEPSIETYVIGVNPLTAAPPLAWMQQIQQLAQMGGGRAFFANFTQMQPVGLAAQMQNARLAALCAYYLPKKFNNIPVYPEFVSVKYYSAGGSQKELTKMASLNACGSDNGWYYDDPTNPRRVVLCPATCDFFQSTSTSETPPQVALTFTCP